MEVYTLDDQFRRNSVIDDYESLVWTERYSQMGDFVIKTTSSSDNRRIFQPDVNLAINESRRVMTIEQIEDKVEDDGRKVLEITGRSIEHILENRVTMTSLEDAGAKNWQFNGTASDVMAELFNFTFRDEYSWFPQDKIPFLKEGSIFPLDTVPKSELQLYFNEPRSSMYAALKKIGEAYDLGFRLVRNYDTSELYFDVYSGVDRTSNQSLVTPVVFSSELDTLQNTSMLESIADFKNVAYVYSNDPTSVVHVFASGADSNTTGFARKVLHVDATDIDLEPGPELNAAMQKRGEEALAEHRKLTILDGEVSQYGTYTYGVDYNVGDMVEMRLSDGTVNQVRVTEQIISSDAEGVRSYPSLVSRVIIEPGTWFGVNYNLVWDNALGTWAENLN